MTRFPFCHCAWLLRVIVTLFAGIKTVPQVL